MSCRVRFCSYLSLSLPSPAHRHGLGTHFHAIRGGIIHGIFSFLPIRLEVKTSFACSRATCLNKVTTSGHGSPSTRLQVAVLGSSRSATAGTIRQSKYIIVYNRRFIVSRLKNEKKLSYGLTCTGVPDMLSLAMLSIGFCFMACPCQAIKSRSWTGPNYFHWGDQPPISR